MSFLGVFEIIKRKSTFNTSTTMSISENENGPSGSSAGSGGANGGIPSVQEPEGTRPESVSANGETPLPQEREPPPPESVGTNAESPLLQKEVIDVEASSAHNDSDEDQNGPTIGDDMEIEQSGSNEDQIEESGKQLLHCLPTPVKGEAANGQTLFEESPGEKKLMNLFRKYLPEWLEANKGKEMDMDMAVFSPFAVKKLQEASTMGKDLVAMKVKKIELKKNKRAKELVHETMKEEHSDAMLTVSCQASEVDNILKDQNNIVQLFQAAIKKQCRVELEEDNARKRKRKSFEEYQQAGNDLAAVEKMISEKTDDHEFAVQIEQNQAEIVAFLRSQQEQTKRNKEAHSKLMEGVEKFELSKEERWLPLVLDTDGEDLHLDVLVDQKKREYLTAQAFLPACYLLVDEIPRSHRNKKRPPRVPYNTVRAIHDAIPVEFRHYNRNVIVFSTELDVRCEYLGISRYLIVASGNGDDEESDSNDDDERDDENTYFALFLTDRGFFMIEPESLKVYRFNREGGINDGGINELRITRLEEAVMEFYKDTALRVKGVVRIAKERV